VRQESLAATIRPSVESLLTALAAYKEAGGDGQLFVNDDGLQLISDADRRVPSSAVCLCSSTVLQQSAGHVRVTLAYPQNARQDVSIQGLMCTPILDV